MDVIADFLLGLLAGIVLAVVVYAVIEQQSKKTETEHIDAIVGETPEQRAARIKNMLRDEKDNNYFN